jgi:signal transduction histidine kinase
MDLVFSKADAGNRKNTLVRLQWVVALATAYLLLFKQGEVTEDPWAFALMFVFLISMAALYGFPQSAYDHRLFAPTLVIVDTILIAGAISLNRDSPWDLFLTFFFCLFLAATGGGLIKIVAGCLLISVFSVMANSISGFSPSNLSSDLFYRIPFLFAVSILYAYLAEQARQDKQRAQSAEQTERLKRQLVSALAHDIKNPLGVVMGYAGMMAERLEGTGHKDNMEALERIQDSARRIVKLVTGFLEASKMEGGTVELMPQPVQLNPLLREVGQQQMADLLQKQLSLKLDLEEPLPDIMGDEGQIDRVLWNLLGNAIKFTPRGGTIHLRSVRENGEICVSVSDTGMGIPKEELPMLFTEFGRLNGSAKIEGTGLGLFIVKTIVEAHGGNVRVESEQGKGSTFTLRFPVSAGTAESWRSR